MANFVATTSSNGVKITDTKGLDKLLERYAIVGEDINAECNDGEFSIWGYDWLSVYPNIDGEINYDEDCLDEFLNELRAFIPAGERFVIQSIGATKCRYPLSAQAIIVTREKVEYWSMPDE